MTSTLQLQNGAASHGSGYVRDIAVPNDPANEQAVLAAMMADDDVRARLVSELRVEHFYANEHKEIFRALDKLTKKKLEFDPATLHRLNPEIDINIVEALAASRATTPNLDYHVQTLRWDARRARIASGPFASLCDLIEDPHASPAQLRAIAKQIHDGFDVGGVEDNGDPFGFRSARDIATPKEPIPMVVPQFGIGPGRPTLLSAFAGSGKTMLTIELLLSVAARRKTAWGGALKLAAHGRTRLIDYELGAPDTDDRSQCIAHGTKIDLAGLRKGNRFRIANFPRMYLSDDPAEVEEALVRNLQRVVLCAIDNFTSATITSKFGQNETGVRAYLDLLTRVSLRTGCTFLVLTHDGKDGKREALKRMRSSSAIADAANSVLSMQTNNVGEIKVTHAKPGNTKKGEPVTVKIAEVGRFDIRVGDKTFKKCGLAIVHVEGASTSEKNEDDGPSDLAVETAKTAIINTLREQEDPPGVRELLRLVKGCSTKAKKAALDELRERRIVIEGQPGQRGHKPLTLAADLLDTEGDNQGADKPF